MRWVKGIWIIGLCFAMPALSQEVAEVRTYEVNGVVGDPPVIDGEYTEEEWAGSEWTGDFYATRHSYNDAALWGQVIEEKYQWRALWDENYFYFLMTAEMKYINMNGWIWPGEIIDTILDADDTGYAGWAGGQCLNIEFFLSPNWPRLVEEGWWNDVGENPPAYHFCYFPLLPEVEGGVELTPGNFGVRGAEGPPFFFSSPSGAQPLPGDWAPITDPVAAEEAGVLRFELAALPHLIEGAVEGEEVVGIPVLELAIPYTTFSFPALPEVELPEDVAYELEPLILIPDENGKYVKPGDEWLFNITCYMDGAVLETTGLGLSNWNDMGEGGFHNAPRGILKFVEAVRVSHWMVY